MREAVQPGGSFQNLSKLPGGSHKQILGSSAPWLGASVQQTSARLRVSTKLLAFSGSEN